MLFSANKEILFPMISLRLACHVKILRVYKDKKGTTKSCKLTVLYQKPYISRYFLWKNMDKKSQDQQTVQVNCSYICSAFFFFSVLESIKSYFAIWEYQCTIVQYIAQSIKRISARLQNIFL